MSESTGGLLASVQQSYMANSGYNTQLPPIQNPDWIARSAVSAMGALPQHGTSMDPHRRQYDAEALEMLSNDMSFSALYMHELHRRRMLNPAYDYVDLEDMHARAIWQSPAPRDNNEDPDPSTSAEGGASLRDRSLIPTRGRALSAVTEASFRTADDEEGSGTELQDIAGSGSSKEEQPLLLPQSQESGFNPIS